MGIREGFGVVKNQQRLFIVLPFQNDTHREDSVRRYEYRLPLQNKFRVRYLSVVVEASFLVVKKVL
jgi:hypothetical protein